MFALIPPQYALLARVLLYAALIATYSAFVWVKATTHQEKIYALEEAKKEASAQKYNDTQVAAQRRIGQSFLEEKRRVEKQRDALTRSLSHALGMFHALQGATAANGPSSAIGGVIPFGDARTADVDARFSAAVQHDARAYSDAYLQLTKLIEACKAAGCDRPNNAYAESH